MKENNKPRRLGIRADLPPDPSSDEQIKLYKRAGFNILTMTEDYVRAKSKAYLDCLKRCEKLGMDVYLRGYPSDVGDYFEKHFTGVDFNQYPAVKGFFLIDEPSKADIPAVARYVNWYNDNYAKEDKDFLINTYCGTHPLIGESVQEVTQYLQLLMDEIYNKLNTDNKILGVDEYPLRRNEQNVPYLSDKEWIPYTALTAKICSKNNVKFSAYMQTFGGGYCDARLPQTIEELRFMAYTYLAFGVSHIDYFVYMSSAVWGFIGIVDETGRPTPLYYKVRSMNEELLSFDIEYLSYTWEGTLFLDGKESSVANAEFSQARDILAYKDDLIQDCVSDRDTIVGCFRKDGNSRAYIVMTYGEPTKKTTNKIEFTFKNAKKLEIVRNGVKEYTDVNGNKAVIEVNSGDGLFIKVK